MILAIGVVSVYSLTLKSAQKALILVLAIVMSPTSLKSLIFFQINLLMVAAAGVGDLC